MLLLYKSGAPKARDEDTSGGLALFSRGVRSAAAPSGLRKALSCCCFAPFARHRQALGLVKNWASSLTAGGALYIKGTTQGLNLSLYEAKDAAWPVEVTCRVLPGRLAVMCFAPAKHFETE